MTTAADDEFLRNLRGKEMFHFLGLDCVSTLKGLGEKVAGRGEAGQRIEGKSHDKIKKYLKDSIENVVFR